MILFWLKVAGWKVEGGFAATVLRDPQSADSF
jgi:hypothetical protein